MKRLSTGPMAALALMALAAAGCNDGEERLLERSRVEGKGQAESELKAQMENLEKLSEKAKAEGRAQAMAELQVQIENMQVLLDRARAEGRAAAEAQLGVQNQNLVQRATEMEADLQTRQSFFQAVGGTYEGTMTTEQGPFNIRLILVPNVPPYTASRIRTLEEITQDLTSLSFNVQVLQWNPQNVLSAVGCRVQHVRPDMMNGTIHIASENCSNFYALRLTDPKEPERDPRELAVNAREGQVGSIGEIRGEVHPTTTASVYRFTAARTSR